MCTQSELLVLLRRVEAEYREMPGLLLTERQMQRLWGLDGTTCERIVTALVASGVLWETSRGAYALTATTQDRRLRRLPRYVVR
jgi:hypothetical protein